MGADTEIVAGTTCQGVRGTMGQGEEPYEVWVYANKARQLSKNTYLPQQTSSQDIAISHDEADW